MVNYFFDTSAIVKYFHEEAGSNVTASIIDSSQNEIWILDIASIEFMCALHRRFRDRELSESNLNSAIEGFNKTITGFHVEETNAAIIQEAQNLVKLYGKIEGLRTLDALHLAAFYLLAEEGWIFVASDLRLFSVAKKMGYSVLNPLSK
jgi:predicted nucleic acid-binding protein